MLRFALVGEVMLTGCTPGIWLTPIIICVQVSLYSTYRCNTILFLEASDLKWYADSLMTIITTESQNTDAFYLGVSHKRWNATFTEVFPCLSTAGFIEDVTGRALKETVNVRYSSCLLCLAWKLFGEEFVCLCSGCPDSWHLQKLFGEKSGTSSG